MALDFFAGCVGGAAGVIVGHPFDTVKVHIQTQTASKQLYRGTLDCLKKIIVKDGARGLYRGITSPLTGVAFINAVVFGVYGNVQRRLPNSDSLKTHALAGFCAGVAQTPICAPMELAKTRLQLTDDKALKSPFQCIVNIYRNEGLRGVFKGSGVTLCREIPGFTSYFFTYELLMRSGDIRYTSNLALVTAGGVAGCCSWIVSYPFDIIKSRYQADGMIGTAKYTGAIDCYRKSVSAEGYGFLYRGLNSALIRAFPMNGACFLVVTWTFRAYDMFDAPKVQEKDQNVHVSTKSIHCEPTVHTKWYESLWRTPESLGIVDHHNHFMFEMYGFQ